MRCLEHGPVRRCQHRNSCDVLALLPKLECEAGTAPTFWLREGSALLDGAARHFRVATKPCFFGMSTTNRAIDMCVGWMLRDDNIGLC